MLHAADILNFWAAWVLGLCCYTCLVRNATASSELYVQLEAHLQIAASPVPYDGVVSCWMNVKKRFTWTALRTRESDVAPCTCSRDQTISTAAVIASFVCVRTQSDVTRIESQRWCADTAMMGRFALSLSLVLLLVSSLPKVTPSAPCRRTELNVSPQTRAGFTRVFFH